MKTIEERSAEYSPKQNKFDYVFLTTRKNLVYITNAKEQKVIVIDKACNIFYHTGCPYKTDCYNCRNTCCNTWKYSKE